jgi:hypothetical protein
MRSLIPALAFALCSAASAQVAQRAARTGDVHIYAVQQKNDRAAFDETVTITAVEGDRIKTSHQRSDRPEPSTGVYGLDWAAYQSGSSGMQLDPPSRVIARPLEQGKTWENTSDVTLRSGAKARIKMQAKVVALEKIATPAGEFEAYRIESQGYLSGLSFQGGTGFVQKVWYAPAIDRLVRLEYKEQRAMGADNVSELKAFKPAP